MSKENFNKFCLEYIPKHPELGLGTDTLNADGFAKVALVEGPKAGFSFTRAEVDEVLLGGGKGQLSDKQLEGVAGGLSSVLSTHAASVNGTAMCYSDRVATNEAADGDWMFIKGEFNKGE